MRRLPTSRSAAQAEEVLGVDHRLRDLGEALATVHGQPAQALVGRFLVQTRFGHQHTLGALDQLAAGQLLLGLAELCAQGRFLFEARDRDLQYRFETLGLQAGDDIGADAGAQGALHRALAAVIGEDDDRPRVLR